MAMSTDSILASLQVSHPEEQRNKTTLIGLFDESIFRCVSKAGLLSLEKTLPAVGAVV